MPVFIALLRAVNVGGTGKLPMKHFRAACERAGLGRVSTYIASGNLVFESDQAADALKVLIEDILRDEFGLAKNDALIRTPRALADAVAANPFPEAARERPNLLMIAFIEGRPAAGAAEALAAFEGPERLHLDGDRLYIDHPAPRLRSRLSPAYLHRVLKAPATSRNWNTVNKLIAMADQLA